MAAPEGRTSPRLGWLIGERRQGLNWSLRELAQRARISPSYLRRIEGTGQVPSRLVIASLARALDLDERSLLQAAGYLSEVDGDALTTEERDLVSLWRKVDPQIRRVLLAAMQEGAEPSQRRIAA